ncbi:fumarylacetoacetate hydrolase family protein [Lacimicrobium alkaliphilum]|uniref:Isomerase/hydrolase n=1 Tax=Lacimicrobium alkaliphilum TaxID=1526571 RepID=A0ABQ1REB0_9ALTE|nr:fumarylacetoacetate hydrolase family protein [Lacimicrobium alkaliphilum]GGD63824.1 isomerase/hydrolase [Lacimicrobium alkaliphilum]
MAEYVHRDHQGQPVSLPAGKVVCVGRNYMDHIRELNNEVPDKPLLFIKPSTSLQPFAGEIVIPADQGECHNELEVAVLIKERLSQASAEQAQAAIWGYGVALDLTLREVQSDLKAKGQPWERAKAFDGSCPVSGFVPAPGITDSTNIDFTLRVNQSVRQQGNTKMMIHPILELICEISRSFTLLPGDLVLTGTPKGVGPLNAGDRLEATLEGVIEAKARVVNGD